MGIYFGNFPEILRGCWLIVLYIMFDRRDVLTCKPPLSCLAGKCIPAACPSNWGFSDRPNKIYDRGPTGQCGGQTASNPELPGSSYGGRKRAQTYILAFTRISYVAVKWFLSNFSFLFQVHDAGGSRDWRSNVRGDDATSVISFWMRQHKTRVGRGPEVKKVTIPLFNLQNLKFPEISFLSIICISCRLLVHIFYEPIRACFDQDG